MIRFVSMIALIAVLAAGVLALPIDVPYTVSTIGKVLPAAEWVLVRDLNGSVETLLRDNVEGTVRSSDVHHFERGDAVHYSLNPSLRARSRVSVGDTVLRIHSNETQRQLAELSGRVATARSAVSLHSSGEKEAVVKAAEQELARALEQAEQQRRTLERLRALRERQLIAEQELEVAASQLQVFQADVDIARARLDAVRTGSKPEELDLAEAAAEASLREMETLSNRLAMQTIVAPISGVAIRSYGTDTLLTVRDTSAAVVVMPVSWKERYRVQIDQHVDVALGDARLSGRIFEIGDSFMRLGSDQVVMVTALVDDVAQESLTGALVECRIDTGPVRLFEYVRRKVL